MADLRHVERCVGFVRKRQPRFTWKYELFDDGSKMGLMGCDEATGVRHALLIPVSGPAIRNKQDAEKEITCAGDDIAAWFRKRLQTEGSGASR